jgi:hypothetical protein
MKPARMKCTVCGEPLVDNPRVQRWLTGRWPAGQTMARLCWVCARLAAINADEAEGLKIYLREEPE